LVQDVKSLDLRRLPATDESSYKWWEWARTNPGGVAFVALDAKAMSLSIGCKVDIRQKHYYLLLTTLSTDDSEKVDESCEVIMLAMQGRANYIANMPTHVL